MKQSIALVPLAVFCVSLDAVAAPPPQTVDATPPTDTPAATSATHVGATPGVPPTPQPAATFATTDPSSATQPAATQPAATQPAATQPAATQPAATSGTHVGATPGMSTKPSSAPPPPTTPSKQKKHPGPFEACEQAKGKDDSASKDCAGVFGLRGSITHSNVKGSENDVGLMFSAQGEDYGLYDVWSTRSIHHLAIGGGAAGFEGISAR
ncbi:MAG: hypothetical protein QM784_14040 [Polyangiaceae bacterium]